jgi:hypothetical protein
MSNDKIIWKELVQTKYILSNIEIQIEVQTIVINICFDNYVDLKNFENYIFNKYYQTLTNIEPYSKSLQLNLNINNYILDFFEILEYPSNTNILNIYIDSKTSNSIKMYKNLINCNNFPSNLSQLKIISLVPFNLSNLPTQIFLLDISECECKLNLDYLPDSINILYLPKLPRIQKINDKYFYKLSDLINLPKSLIEINFGINTNNIYKSTKELIDLFIKK